MLPKQVREAAERANQIHQQVYGNTGNPALAPTGGEQVPPSAEVPPVAPEVPVVPVAEPSVPVANWEEKYRVLNGKYQAEVPRLAAEVRGLKETIEELRVAAAAAPAPAPAVPLPVAGMTLAEVEEKFGEDFASAVRAIAVQIADDSTSRVREEFKPKLETVEKRTQENARDSFIRELTSLVPDWQAIDTDDSFTTYLDEVDDLSGRSRRFFFQEADKHNDAARIARFFKAFKGNSNAVAAPAAPTPNPAVEALLQPATSRITDVPKGKRIWTQADIRQFYVDVRRGRYTPQESHRIESDIFTAQRENRMAA